MEEEEEMQKEREREERKNPWEKSAQNAEEGCRALPRPLQSLAEALGNFGLLEGHA